jgi:hypothetical protein
MLLLQFAAAIRKPLSCQKHQRLNRLSGGHRGAWAYMLEYLGMAV